jgi:serralysin
MATRLEMGIDWGTELPDRNVTYHFAAAGEASRSPLGRIVSDGFFKAEKEQFKLAFDIFASFINVRFFEVSQSAAADFNLVTFGENSSLLGAMAPPGLGKYAGVGVFNYLGLGWNIDSQGRGGLAQGGFGFVTIIHELGHGFGLAHPHDRGGSSTVFPGVHSSSDLGDHELNQGIYTMMSYNDGWATHPDGEPPSLRYGYIGTPMAIDIAVLQDKYGANTAHKVGNNLYRLPDVNQAGTFFSCIWDAGGEDTIANRSSLASTIDLRPATLKPEPGGGGFISHVDGIFGGFTIANGVAIERARGGSAADDITGNRHDNRLQGNGGDDILRARGGEDHLIGGGGEDQLFGGVRADRLQGNQGADRLNGWRGDDRLDGGAGPDTLRGGPGKDDFVFAAEALHSVDTVVDFLPGHDLIHLSRAVFGTVGGEGPLAAARFGLGDVAKDQAERILYDPVTGVLRFDRDGTNSAKTVQFARLDAGLGLSEQDFVVVA